MQTIKGVTALFFILVIIIFIAEIFNNVQQFNAVGNYWL